MLNCVSVCMSACMCVSMRAFKYLCMCWGHRSTLHVQHLLLLPQQWDYKHISPGFCVCMCVQCVFRGSKSGGLRTVRTLTAEHGPRHFKVLFLRSLLSDSAPTRMLLPRKQTSMVFVAELGHLIEVNALLTLKFFLISEDCWVFLKECGCLMALATGRKQSPPLQNEPPLLGFHPLSLSILPSGSEQPVSMGTTVSMAELWFPSASYSSASIFLFVPSSPHGASLPFNTVMWSLVSIRGSSSWGIWSWIRAQNKEERWSLRS